MAGKPFGGLGQQIGQGGGLHLVGQMAGFGQAVADGGKVTGAAAVQRQARQGAVQIRHVAQMLADVIADRRCVIGKADRVQTGLNRL